MRTKSEREEGLAIVNRLREWAEKRMTGQERRAVCAMPVIKAQRG
jgi:hypothetical protein